MSRRETLIDWSRVQELRVEIGDDAFADVVELFLEEVEQAIDTLRTDPDPARLESDLHFLKGSALNLGFAKFSQLCESGERLSAAGEAGEVDLPTVIESFECSRTAFLDGLTAEESAQTNL